MAPDKKYQDKYFGHENIYCGNSLEAPQRGASNELPQYIFLRVNKKISKLFRLQKSALSGDMTILNFLVEHNKRNISILYAKSANLDDSVNMYGLIRVTLKCVCELMINIL